MKILLIAEHVSRYSGSLGWEAVAEMNRQDVETYINDHNEEWSERGDGSGTNFAVVPEGKYTTLDGDYAWIPRFQKEVDSEFSPY